MIIKSKRLGQLTSVEVMWLDMLKRSNLNLTEPFSAKNAVEAIKHVPLKKGGVLRNVPTHHRIFSILKRAEGFQKVEGRGGCSNWIASE